MSFRGRAAGSGSDKGCERERKESRVSPRFLDRWICYLLRWGRPEKPLEVSAAWFEMGYV